MMVMGPASRERVGQSEDEDEAEDEAAQAGGKLLPFAFAE